MLEWYRAGRRDGRGRWRDTEQLVAAVTGGAVRLGERVVDVPPPFERITGVRRLRAVRRLVAATRRWRPPQHDEERYFRALVDQVEPALAALDHGACSSWTTRPRRRRWRAGSRDDPRVAERFELYVAGVELCNGFGELVDPVEQRARLVARPGDAARAGPAGLPHRRALPGRISRGFRRARGNALGLDRLVALVCGTTEIAGRARLHG